MGKLIVELPDEIHGEFKKRAAVDEYFKRISGLKMENLSQTSETL